MKDKDDEIALVKRAIDSVLDYLKRAKCCYCKFWKSTTENGQTGWCDIKMAWMNLYSTCEDCNIEE